VAAGIGSVPVGGRAAEEMKERPAYRLVQDNQRSSAFLSLR